MKIEDADLDRIYYYIYSNESIPAILLPIDVKDSGLGPNHFWTDGYFYDSQVGKWYFQEGTWIIGNKDYTEMDRIDQGIKRGSIKSLFERGISR